MSCIVISPKSPIYAEADRPGTYSSATAAADNFEIAGPGKRAAQIFAQLIPSHIRGLLGVSWAMPAAFKKPVIYLTRSRFESPASLLMA